MFFFNNEIILKLFNLYFIIEKNLNDKKIIKYILFYIVIRIFYFILL